MKTEPDDLLGPLPKSPTGRAGRGHELHGNMGVGNKARSLAHTHVWTEFTGLGSRGICIYVCTPACTSIAASAWRSKATCQATSLCDSVWIDTCTVEKHISIAVDANYPRRAHDRAYAYGRACAYEQVSM